MSSLHALGFVPYLDHHGERRPNLSITHPRPMTAVHTNGFHKFGVQFVKAERRERFNSRTMRTSRELGTY